MQFSIPLALWLLWLALIPFLVMWVADRKYQIYLASVFKSKNSKILPWVRSFLASGLIACLVLILANPIHLQSIQNPLKNGVDILFVLDLSKSMLAEDIAPNRIDAGKRVLTNFISERPDDRIGLIGFAGKPFVFSPLTFDRKSLTSIVGNITVDSIKQEIPGFSGTAIWDALLLATDAITNDIPERKKILILLTDGEANVGIDPKIANEYVKKTNTTVHTIGIGDAKGTDLYTTDAFGKKMYFMDRNGVPIHASIDEPLLKKIASDNNGLYANAATLTGMEKALDDLSKLYGKTLVGKPETTVKSYAPYLAYLAVGITIIWLLLELFSITSAFHLSRFTGIVLTVESSNFIQIPWLIWTKRLCLLLGIILLITGALTYKFIPPLGTISLLIDGSKSMSVEDVGSTRLTLAKEIGKKIIDHYTGTPIRISLFWGDIQTIVPSTYDPIVLKQSLDALSWVNLSGWSDIIGSLRSLIQSSWEEVSTVFIISDGEVMGNSADLKDTYLDVPSDMSLWSIGVGTEKGGYIPLGRDLFGKPVVKLIDGNPVISKYADELLQKIVRNGWKYQHITDLRDLQLESTNTLPKNTQSIIENLFIVGAISLLFWLLLPHRKRITS